MTPHFVYLPDAGIAINLSLVTDMVFLPGRAHISLGENDAYETITRADTTALIQALQRLTDNRSAEEMRARVAEPEGPRP